jgi:hexosaminidase
VFGDKASVVPVARDGDAVVLTLPPSAPDADSSVVILNIAGAPDVSVPPTITADANQFVDTVVATIASEQKNVQVHYTINGSEPTTASPIATGPITVANSLTIKARSFRDGRIVSPIVQSSFEKVAPRPAVQGISTAPGLKLAVFDLPADIKTVAEMAAMKPVKEITTANFDLAARPKEIRFAMRFTGYVNVPSTGMYRFYTNSDDGSTLRIGDTLVVDNDKPHSVEEKSGVIALQKGLHPITVDFFENSGGFELKVGWQGPGFAKELIPAAALARKSGN